MTKAQAVKEFLLRHGISADSFDLALESERYAEFLGTSLAGSDDSGLCAIPTFVSADINVKEGEKVIVVDAGGTNLRVATVIFEGGGARVEYFQKYAMPGTEGAIEYEQFNETLCDYLMPVINESDYVGICFSYECNITKERDGLIVALAKEVYVNGAKGNLVCEGVAKTLAKRGITGKKYCLVNDAVASLMGGVACSDPSRYDGYIGFILGTGTNLCYSEPTELITKNPEAMAVGGSMIINTESGKYIRMPRAELDITLDNGTLIPGDHLMEKMTGGAYQGGMFLLWLKQAAQDGLFSAGTAANIAAMQSLQAMNIDKFCFDPLKSGELNDLCTQPDDIETILLLADAMFERIAKLTVLQFAGVLIRTGRGKSKVRPVCVVAEGTTFYKSKYFRPKLNYYFEHYLEKQLGRYIEIISADNANLIGTAAAVVAPN